MPEHEHARGTGRRQGHIRIVVRTRDPPIRARVNVRAPVHAAHTRKPRLCQGLSPALPCQRFSVLIVRPPGVGCVRVGLKSGPSIFDSRRIARDSRRDPLAARSRSDNYYSHFASPFPFPFSRLPELFQRACIQRLIVVDQFFRREHSLRNARAFDL